MLYPTTTTIVMGNRPIAATFLCYSHDGGDDATEEESKEPLPKSTMGAMMDDLSQTSYTQHPHFCTSMSSETMGREARTDRDNLSRMVLHDERDEVVMEERAAPEAEEHEEVSHDENQDPAEQNENERS